jgi:hypothetical protein
VSPSKATGGGGAAGEELEAGEGGPAEELEAAAEELEAAADGPPAPPSVGKPYCGLVPGRSAVWPLFANEIAIVPFHFAAGCLGALSLCAAGFVAGCMDLWLCAALQINFVS